MTDDLLGDEFSPAPPPSDITHLLRERTEARINRDWDRADELKAQIEAAGWRVVDRGKRSSVHPAAPLTVELDGERRYGSAADVTDAWAEPTTGPFSVVLVASEEPARLARLLTALRAHAPVDTQVVIVMNDPSAAQMAALATDAPDRAPIGGREPELLRTAVRLGYGAALNIGLRRAAGEIVLLADGSAVPAGDAFAPLAAALADPDVVAAGGHGLLAEEGVPFRPNTIDRGESDPEAELEVAALEGAWLAFRREELIALGRVDEHFVTPAWLDVWLTLRLRVGDVALPGAVTDAADESPNDSPNDSPDGERDGVEGGEADERLDSDGPAGTEPSAPGMPDLPAPKQALVIDLPLEREAPAWPPERTRLNRRNMYRVLDTFGWRDDLA